MTTASRGLAALVACVLLAALAITALAQSPAPRVVQGSDGTLYVVQGGNAWVLVPDQIADADLAALNLSGEIYGTLPGEVLSVPDDAPPAAPAQSEPVAAPTAAPAGPLRTAPQPAPTAAPAFNAPAAKPTTAPAGPPVRAPAPTAASLSR